MAPRPSPAPAGVLALGVDVGTTNTKAAAVVVPDAGEPVVVATAKAATPADGDALVSAVVGLVRTLVERAGRPPDVVGIASMAETGVPLDDGGAPVGPLLRWDRGRGATEADGLASVLGAGALFAATGVRVSPKAPLVAWHWLRRHEPGTWRRMRRWAGAADLVCLAMTGRLVTDHTLAGRSLAYRLPADGEPLPHAFDPELLDVVGLVPDQLPAVARPDEVAGDVRAGPFTDAGLAAGTPVVVAGHDHAVGAHAAGARAPGAVADSVGTAEAVVTVLSSSPAPAAVAEAGMSLVRTVGGRHPALLAGSAGGAMVDWWARSVAAATPVEVFSGEVASGPTGVLVLPYPHGRQAPAPDPSATVSVLGARAAHTRAHLTKALLEGLCLQTRWVVTEQRRLSGGTAADGVVALGTPLTSNPGWVRTKAHVLSEPLRLVPSPEPVAVGAALVAAERAGLVSPERSALPSCPVPSPSGHGGAEYTPVFEAFVRAARGLPAPSDGGPP